MLSGHRPYPPTWTRPQPAIAAVAARGRQRGTRVAMSAGLPQDRHVSTLVASGRTLAGHPSGASDRRGHQHGHRHQRGHVCRTQPVRTAVVPEAANGQSADRSGSLQLPLLSSRPALRAAACGGRPRVPVSSPASRASRAASACWSRRRTAWGSWPDRAWRPPATRPRDATGAPHVWGNLKAPLSHDDGTSVPVSP